MVLIHRCCLYILLALFVIYVLLYILFFFFFQAEDGIRDHCVTRVQTCALPISIDARRARAGGRSQPRDSWRSLSRPAGLPLEPKGLRPQSRRVGPAGLPRLR